MAVYAPSQLLRRLLCVVGLLFDRGVCGRLVEPHRSADHELVVAEDVFVFYVEGAVVVFVAVVDIVVVVVAIVTVAVIAAATDVVAAAEVVVAEVVFVAVF